MSRRGEAIFARGVEYFEQGHVTLARDDAQAFALCDRVVRHLMAQSNGRYVDAVDAVRMACKRLANTEARRCVEQLRVDFKAKRNFTKALGNVIDP